MFDSVLSLFTRMVPYRFTGEHVPCNLCGGTERRVVGTRDRYLQPLRTVMCEGCGLVFTDPMPTDEEVTRYYTRHYRKHYHNADLPRKKAIYKGFRGAKPRYGLLAPVLPDGGRLVDVGAGGGEFVSHAAEQGADAIGIEPNEGFARFARERYGVDIRNTMWATADIEPGSVDVVTANHVVEHFRDPIGALRGFREWLKPGGHLFVSVPNIHRPNRTPYARFHFAHLYNFSAETLRMTALKAGYELTDMCHGFDTTIVVRKPLEEPAAAGVTADVPRERWFIYPESARERAAYFATYTNKRFFLSTTAYTRWFQRMYRLSRDMILAGASVSRRS